MIVEKEISDVQVDMMDYEKTKVLMDVYDIKFLVDLLRRYKPKNMLEVGVAAGGSTYYILKNLGPKARLTSVDIRERWFGDESKETGFVVSELMGEIKEDRWKKLFGKDIVYYEDQMKERGPFDFVFIDTVHSMPGEFLTFLAILPFVKNGTPIVFHDTFLHYHLMVRDEPFLTATMKDDRLDEVSLNQYCNNLLTSSASSRHKEIPKTHCNIGMLIKDRSTTKNILDVIRTMCIPWFYMPPKDMLDRYSEFMKRYYDETCSKYFDMCIEYETKYFSIPHRMMLYSDNE